MNPIKPATYKFGASQVECDADPYDCSDAIRCDISDSVTMESDAVRVKPEGDSAAERFRSHLSCLHRTEVRRVECSFPTYLPEYMRFKSRLQTFKDKWPKYLPGPSPEELARAGFFYLGEGDKVKCFSCGVTLHQWEPDDSAYLEHARWSPNCKYLPLVGHCD